ncbi:MAG TPA: GNAT family N-acetyltransferase [Solirubrobacterales bacterium]|nr:GNAT family N-acetyltransferase [Solirubrobacterales bacterium]
MQSSGEIHVRRALRPGDLGAIVEMHGRVYGREYGNDARFEGMVAGSVARAAARGFPSRREGIWIVERDGEHCGSTALTDEGDGTAMVRWVLLDASLRGAGLGRRMIGELVEEARGHGYEKLCLETFSLLRAAAHIYRSFGFEIVSTDSAPRWGHERIDYQRYELDLQSTSTKAPPRRGSPPPSNPPSASRATA